MDLAKTTWCDEYKVRLTFGHNNVVEYEDFEGSCYLKGTYETCNNKLTLKYTEVITSNEGKYVFSNPDIEEYLYKIKKNKLILKSNSRKKEYMKI